MPPVFRLLTIGHSYVLGVNRRLAHAMATVGAGRWQVTVAAPEFVRGHHDIRPAILQDYANEPVPVIPLPTYMTFRTHSFCYGRTLKTVLNQGWDLIHSWEEPYIISGAQTAWLAPKESRFVFRTAQSLNKNYPIPFNWLERKTVARADGWICSGMTVAENLRERPGYANKPMALIPLGVDLQKFQPNAAAGKVTLERLGWSDDGTPVIGYLGRYIFEKGVPFLTRVLNRISGRWRALLVGGGPLADDLHTWAKQHGDRVRILTDVSHNDVPDYLNAMTLLAAPSLTTRWWREQFGRMLIEAFACGVPVVGSNSGEMPHVIDDAGLVLPEGDEAAWVNGMELLLADRTRRETYISRGLARISQYDWQTIAKQHLDFFEQILDTGQSNCQQKNAREFCANIAKS